MTYGYEDTDYKTKGDESTGYAFNAATSTFFCRIRDLFVNELQDMYVQCESAGAWNAEGLINQFDIWQSEFPEELWRLDIERKYLRTYRNGSDRFLKSMANGKKKYQRRQFERNQEKYMASKFFGNVAKADQIMFRCNTPTDASVVVAPNYTLYLTPYSDMYLDVMFGATSPIQIRAEAGKQYSIECPYSTMDDTAVLVYCASMIQSMGDLSACYIHDNDFSKASKLKELIIGNAIEGYQNSFLTNLGIGNNTLLEKLDIQNTPNLAQALDLSKCNNLKELYAHGSGLTGVTFADGGMIEIAQLPAVTALAMRNLIYLTDFDVSSFDNLTTLIAENCSTINIQNVLAQGTNINRVRIIGINWTLDDTTLLEKIYAMAGVDKSGYNIAQSVLSGKVHVASIKQKQLENYKLAWPDLEITYNTLVAQYTVKFLNQDGTVLDIQYVDKGNKPVDPTTRENNPIPVPTLSSTVSTDYIFDGWDSEFVEVFDNTIIRATYTETTREYTIRYMSYGNILQETKAKYGTLVSYTGETPTYTIEESAYKYYLFDGWDKSGHVTGNKIINALYDSCEYTDGYFIGKEIADMRPVEIYMMTKLGLSGVISLTDYIESKDSLTIQLGNDFSYTDIEEQVLISEKTVFDGTNYIDTGVQLLSEDRDFVLAIDCKMNSGNSNGVLAQCFSGLDTSGFKLSYNNGPKLVWGSSSTTPFGINSREMLVLRHVKGENGIHVYSSNVAGDTSFYVELSGAHSMVHSVSLIFGCNKLEDGSYEQYGNGIIYWSKLWYADLGDSICAKIANWPHEDIDFEVCYNASRQSDGTLIPTGLKRYYLSDGSGIRSSITFISSTTLSYPVTMDAATTSTNAGGWANYALNRYLNNRVYKAFPDKWKQLLKQVKVLSSIGEKSVETSSSDCYVFIPSISELTPGVTGAPYDNEGSIILHFSDNNSRICYNMDGVAVQYWTRSPSIGSNLYVYRITNTGSSNAFTTLSMTDVYPRIMICF